MLLLLLLTLFEKGITNAACCQEEDYHTEKGLACKNNYFASIFEILVE